MKKLRVAVVMGGRSSEYAISQKSGREVVKNLDKKRYETFPVIVGKDGNLNDLLQKIKSKIDIAFIAMHGEHAEDGSIQGLFEVAGIPYTGPRLFSAALTMDKIFSRKLFKLANLNVPKDLIINKGQNSKIAWKHLKPPVVVKPHNQGSSIGVSIIHKQNKLAKALNIAWSYSQLAIVEEYIKGMEVAGSVLGNQNPIALPLVEIVPKKEFFDYEAKYSSALTDEICPARLNKALTKKVQETSIKAYKTLGCTVFSRVDMIIKKNKIYVLEVNPIPGLTSVSLFPKAAEAAGISYSKLLDLIISYSINK